MPGIVGSFKINNVGPSSNVQIGDSASIVLTSNSKIHAGANSFSPGDSFGGVTNNQASITNTNDQDLNDAPSANVV
jgi:spore germination protein PA